VISVGVRVSALDIIGITLLNSQSLRMDSTSVERVSIRRKLAIG
jgi:hypothetical protein